MRFALLVILLLFIYKTISSEASENRNIYNQTKNITVRSHLQKNEFNEYMEKLNKKLLQTWVPPKDLKQAPFTFRHSWQKDNHKGLFLNL